MDNVTREIFENLKVVEMAGVLAGPSVGMFFSELGAQVIKIENPNSNGDVTRSWKLPSEKKSHNVSAYFSSINYKKKYVSLDLKSEEDRNKLKSLIRHADILITNHKKGKEKEFGIEFQELKKSNPGLIQCHLKGFDSNESRSAFDVVVQAETGYMYMNGDENSTPLKMPLAMMDVLAAHQMKEAILIALLKRLKTGGGSYIECSLEKSGLANLTNQASNYLMEKFIPQPIGSEHPNIAPYGENFECNDGKRIVLAVGSNIHFQKMCVALGNENLVEDPRFENNQNRVLNRKELQSELRELFKAKSSKEWLNTFIKEGIPAGVIKNMKEVFQNKVAKNMILEEEIEGQSTKRISTIAFDFKQ